METNKVNYSLIQQYLDGSLDPERMHALEKQALEDPFLAEALDGYSKSAQGADRNLSLLQRQLEERIARQHENKSVLFFTWQRLSVAAAAGLLFIVAGILFWMKGTPSRNDGASGKQVEVQLTPPESVGKDLVADPHSYARPQEAVVRHLQLDLSVDFNNEMLSGKAEWSIENVGDADSIYFDTRQLRINKVTLDDGKPAQFNLSANDPYLGQALAVRIRPSTRKVTIWYSTARDAAALQWLKPGQTAGKKHPFLYTQSQAILARTWIPCQDSPGIRFSYNASVSVPQGLLALMSASNPLKETAGGKYSFEQSNPVPSYLMALAVGDLDFHKIDGRTGIYAEPATLKAAAWEFADMGRMVEVAEKLYGPYRWGRFDVLVLPPGFPYGGMENPMLTFATPTVIAGDRSLVSLIAHELAHSWSGNLVTNATWNDFWLNEGFTVYFERRIIEELYGKQEAAMQEVLGFEILKTALSEMGQDNPDTRLMADFTGRDPDEGTTDIAYEKGYFFLRRIEEVAGRDQFDSFLKRYFKEHAFQSVTTGQFIDYLRKHLLAGKPHIEKEINIKEWVFSPGIPKEITVTRAERFEAIDKMLAGWKPGADLALLKAEGVGANGLMYFIRSLPAGISAQDMALIDKEMRFTQSRNSEIQCLWYALAIKHQYKPAYPAIEDFLMHVGRRKFLLTLYQEMARQSWSKEWARQIYKKARSNYHPVSYNTIDKILAQ